MLDLLFGTHIAGWKAMFQFWFWFAIAAFFVMRWMKSNIK
jgi:hypothetical protein